MGPMKRFVKSHCAPALALVPATLLLVALTGGLVDARQSDELGDTRPAVEQSAAEPSAGEVFDPALAWVDPVITGPVSPEFKRQREAAGCDVAVWPHIPTVCFPDGIVKR